MRSSLLSSRAIFQPSFLCSRRHFTSTTNLSRVYQEGDIVLLRAKRDRSHDGILVKLRTSKEFVTHFGKVSHAEIIGKSTRQVIRTSKGHDYRIHEPTLAEYVRLSPRLVTPVYPNDANIIVSLLDIHVDAPTPGVWDNQPPLEILEAGTGHGALTLHLSRAIHAANPPRPVPPQTTSPRSSETTQTEPDEDPVYQGETISDLYQANLETWKSQRRAILHTVDASSKYSKHAQRVVQFYRRGMYAGNVDFHVGDVSAWISSQFSSRNTTHPFLNHVILDMPNANLHVANVAKALKVDGLLAVFNPSITQIAEIVELVREERLPFVLDQVVELGSEGVRRWDVRSVVPRGGEVEEALEEGQASVSNIENAKSAEEGQAARDQELAEESVKRDEERTFMVCRPKVGERVVGGGFLGLWRRMEPPEGYEG
ncbi:S-adenosyl-L-methionine-dependent methyltransferase [Delitschia confertaspora ATCC 74209]|uniref:tRNA (adenine(58)-N(1))-methyltransferase catalytic subunit TRM61 n=1 Tax=Delitschia confertaspora ATCC 74209 TaxID=1513339 RepID=A0A9P4JUA2_9PLEO|nr:S-adenosyl-L-methionine-dependent methyltransferase [Delitschia confertaspora ATCC 74209]